MAAAPSGPAAAAAAAAIAASLSAAPLDASLAQQLYAGPSAGAHAPTSIVLGATETKEGLYGTYQVEKAEQKYDDARSTFKSKEATKAGRNKYIPVFAVLLVGSFIIPMAQYFWCAPRARASSPERGARGFRRSVHASRRAAPALRRYVRDTRGFDAFEAQEEIKASKKKSWFGQ